MQLALIKLPTKISLITRNGIHNFHLPTARHTWCPEPFELRPLVRSHAGITRLGFVRWQMDALALLLICFLRKGLGSCTGRASSDFQEDDKRVVWNGSDCMESSRPEFMLAFATASLPFGELHNLRHHARCLLAGAVITLHHTQDSPGMTVECAVINIATQPLECCRRSVHVEAAHAKETRPSQALVPSHESLLEFLHQRLGLAF